MIQGIKTKEYRAPSKWIETRLIGKNYDLIKFVNGYGSDKPFFICEYKGYEINNKKKFAQYDNNKIEINKGDYVINLGKIIQKGNL